MSALYRRSGNARTCRHCGEEVLLKKQKKHFEEFHHIVTCVKCGKDVMRCQEAFHLAYECKKPHGVMCQFCALLLPRGKIKKHEELCGSRTAVCDKCDMYILIKDRDKHLRSCNGENPALPCEFCERLIPANMLGSHQQQCLIERERTQVITEASDGTFWDNKQTSIGSRTDETRSTTEAQRRRKEKAPDGPNIGKDGRQKSPVEEKSIIALPCEICGELCPSDKLVQHQKDCNEESQNRHDDDSPRSREGQTRAEQNLPFKETKPTTRKQDSPEVPRERYIEIQRSYSPTIQFEDEEVFTEGFPSYFHSFTRTRGETPSSQPPRDVPSSSDRYNGFSAGIPAVRYIEIERSYTPTIEFGEEHFPEATMHFIPENLHIQQTFDWFESRHSS